MSVSIRKAALLIACLPVFLCAHPGPLSASEIAVEAQVGFRGLFQLGHPFPLTVNLINAGRPVEGTLEVKVWKGGPTKGTDPYPFYYQRPVLLSAQSQRGFQFIVDPDSVSRPLTVTFSGPAGEVSREIDLRRHFSPSPLSLLLTENSIAPSVPLEGSRPAPLISLSVSELPAEARAYQGVSAILFYEQSLRDLSKAQAAALEGWLSSGGTIVVLGSIHYALYQEPAMSRFLPVRVSGLKRLASLPSLESALKGKASPLRNLLVQDSKPVEGRVLVEEAGAPILVESSRGRGRLLYLALDIGRPPLSRWDGLPLLFAHVGPFHQPERAPLTTSWDESVITQLFWNPTFLSTYVPIRAFFLWLLFYVGGVLLLAWLWRRQSWPRRTLSLALLLLIVFAGFGGYFQFVRGGQIPDGVLLASTLLESVAEGYAEAQSNIALFSTQRRDYNLRVESGWSGLEPVPRSGLPGGALVVREEGGSSGFSFPLEEWDYRLFRVRSVTRFPIRVELENKGDRFSLRLANLSSRDLTDCWLLLPGQRYFLGDILQGSSQTREFSAAPAEGQAGRQEKIDLRDIPFGDRTRELLIRYSFFPPEQGMSRWGSGAALFFGWVRGAPRRIWVDDPRVSTHEYALFRAVLPLEDDGEL